MYNIFLDHLCYLLSVGSYHHIQSVGVILLLKKEIRNMDKRTSLLVKKKILRSFEKSEAVYLVSQRHMPAERNPQARRRASSESGQKNSVFKIFISNKS